LECGAHMNRVWGLGGEPPRLGARGGDLGAHPK